MGSYYSLIDRTTDEYLIDCPGREIMKVAWFFDDPENGTPEIRIFTRWEHYDLSCGTPPKEDFDAASVARDLSGLVDTLSGLEPDLKIGRIAVADWARMFSAALEHVLKNPDHIYASRYFE